MRYAVVKQGVYIHDVFGPYTRLDAARIKAQHMAVADDDSHHSWDVRELTHQGLGDEVFGSYHKLDAQHHADVLRQLAMEARDRKFREGKPGVVQLDGSVR